MIQSKALGKRERRPSLKAWVSEAKGRWRRVPEIKIDSEKLKHLAIICDGDRRSAQEKGFHPWQGHKIGVEVMKGIMNACRHWNIRYLTFWVWSTENWQRDRQQVDFIMSLAKNNLRDREIIEEFLKNQVRFTHFGRKDRLPEEVKRELENLEEQTRGFDRYFLNLALDYGGMDEMARAIVKIIDEVYAGKLTKDQILENPDIILGFLDTTDQPLPDLVVRTGVREDEIPHTSRFLPLQTGYSSWAFLPDYFPDLEPEILLNAIKKFLNYKRRFGR